MDARRFDAIARALISETSRRRTLGGLLGGALAALGLAAPAAAEAAKSGKCKQECGACETCRKGACKRKNGKKRCRPGKCKLRQGLEECGEGEVRNPLTCDCCQTNGQECTLGNDNLCCSEGCFDIGSTNICRGRPGGNSCEFGAQCESGVCSGGECADD